MDVTTVIEQAQQVAAARRDHGAGPPAIEAGLASVSKLRAWLDASEAELAGRLASQVSFPESAIADTSRTSVGSASRTIERSRTLDAVPPLADALDTGRVTSGHVDAVTRAAKGLEPDQRDRLLGRVGSLLDVAERATVAEFDRRVRDEARRLAADDGMNRLERQRRATALRTWVDGEGMWNLRGRFDPVTGVRLASRLDGAVETLFAEETPATCPSDPVAKQHHLRALALDRLLAEGRGSARGRPGRPEFVVVIDVAAPTASAGTAASTGIAPTVVEWPIPVEIPERVLAELAGDGEVEAVVVRNGVVLHAPGRLDLGRTTRLANRAQRRALRGLYATCAIPGCTVRFDRCTVHHVIWWRHGGRTDLDNLLPLCTRHHHEVHDGGWVLSLADDRRLTVRCPDGTVRITGPPSRRAERAA